MLKKVVLLLLLWCFCLSLAACAPSGDPSQPAEKSDEEMISSLLADCKGLDLPNISYKTEFSVEIPGQGSFVLEALVSVKGPSCAMEQTLSLMGQTATTAYCYSDGIFYATTAQGNVKSSLEDPALVKEAVRADFLLAPTLFTEKRLLRSEDGSFYVVLSQADPASHEEIAQQLAVMGELKFSSLSDIYTSLHFSSDGKLLGGVSGFTMTLLDGGSEFQVEVEGVHEVLSLDPSQITVTVPENADAYAEATAPLFSVEN